MSRHALILAFALLAPFACSSDPAASDDDDGGCETDMDCKGDRLCIDGSCTDPGDASCAAVDASCDAQPCCDGALCALYGGAEGTTVCEALCLTNVDCASGCCAPLGDSGQSTCAPAEFCNGGQGGEGGSPPRGGSAGGPSQGGSPPGGGSAGSPAPGN